MHIGNPQPLAAGASELLRDRFGALPEIVVAAPGRVNLIGEHIDYHDLPALPMAIQRRIWIACRVRKDGLVRAASDGFGEREFSIDHTDEGVENAGDWGHYLRAAARAAAQRWRLRRGMDAAIVSDLPPAAGLASSSALLTGVMLALLEANCILATVGELMEVLPEGERLVGTRGGGLDHAATLAGREGSALLVRFAPMELRAISIPGRWRFLVVNSGHAAEKSAALRNEYNRRRTAGARAMEKLGLGSYRAALAEYSPGELKELGTRGHQRHPLDPEERDAFLHTVTEARRVEAAAVALRNGDAETFGDLLTESHTSLRDRLHVSTPEIDALVQTATNAGAVGARITGAGFGGCAIACCLDADYLRVEAAMRGHVLRTHGPDAASHDVFEACPAEGALYANAHAGIEDELHMEAHT